MSVIIFLLGFMLCGFIACVIFVFAVCEVLRGEEICGLSVEFKHKSHQVPYRYNANYATPIAYQTYTSPSAIRKRVEKAKDIVEIFDDFLISKDIKVPSEDDGDRGDDNCAAIYGCDYSELVNKIESVI